jgi:hypothetical protein
MNCYCFYSVYEDAGFLPVQIGGHSGAGDIEIIYPNGVRVRLGGGEGLEISTANYC